MSAVFFARFKAFLQGIFLVLFGVILTFLFFEIAFRAGGFVYRAWGDYRNHVALSQGGATRVLCLGESTTEMGGENSYPRQLEKILNEKDPRRKFAVINGGIPGGNTTGIVARLPKDLKQYHPEIVVLMMGVNDFPLLDQSLQKDLPQKNALISVLEHSRLARLFQGLWAASQKKKENTVDRMFADEEMLPTQPQDKSLLVLATTMTAAYKYQTAIGVYKELIKRNAKFGYWPNAWFYRKIGWIYNKLGEREKFMASILNILELNGKDAWAVDRVMEICSVKKDEVLITSLLGTAIKHKPNDWALFQLMASCSVELGNAQAATKYFQEAHRLRVEEVNPVTRDNFREALDILVRQNIKVVLVQYPMRPLDELQMTVEGLDNLNHAVFVDNEDLFKQALMKTSYEDYFIDRFAGDFGHCTPKGNHLLAEHVAETILSLK